MGALWDAPWEQMAFSTCPTAGHCRCGQPWPAPRPIRSKLAATASRKWIGHYGNMSVLKLKHVRGGLIKSLGISRPAHGNRDSIVVVESASTCRSY